MNIKDTIMFRFVPTMRCNFRCEYCFENNHVKSNGKTMFDDHEVADWVLAIKQFDDYDVELYFWGGEPFCIDGTYELLRECTKMEHIISGIRIDTNTFFAEKIIEKCPSNKIKLNCSYHMQYHTLDEEFEKIKLLKEYDMVGMVNFVASKYNLTHLRDDYNMTVMDLINLFDDIGVFVNIAGDFKYANNPAYEKYSEYKDFILQFITSEEWQWLRGEYAQERLCAAGQRMFTVEHNGDFTSCISMKKYGNLFDGILRVEKEPLICNKDCLSLVSYPFRCDNDFPSRNNLMAYVDRNQRYRKFLNAEYKDFIF